MDGDLITTFLLFMPVGLPFLYFGYLIAVKKQTHLIAGWDAKRVHSPDQFASVFGWGLVCCAAFFLVVAYLISARILAVPGLIISILAIVVAVFGIGAYCKAKFSD